MAIIVIAILQQAVIGHFPLPSAITDSAITPLRYAGASSLKNEFADNSGTINGDGNPVATGSQASVELTTSKEYPSGIWPVEQQYVKYDLQIRNVGTGDLQNEVLWVRFVSLSERTLHTSNFVIPELHSGDVTTLHLGPFKMIDSSDHTLYVGMNKHGDSSIPNDIIVQGSSPSVPLDSFKVFSQPALQSITMGSIISVTGIGVILMYFVWRIMRKRQNQRGTTNTDNSKTTSSYDNGRNRSELPPARISRQYFADSR